MLFLKVLMLILVGLYIKAGADMTGADMPGADMTGADMTGADMTGADMPGADMTGADMTGADMPGADLAIYRANTRCSLHWGRDSPTSTWDASRNYSTRLKLWCNVVSMYTDHTGNHSQTLYSCYLYSVE
jgi:hypothetical protein